MAFDNRTLGRFDLIGLPPAPRGIPQIEVAFDIDANGIVHVSAKDLGTGKEQSIKIQVSSGISEQEIKKMVKDAEAHSDEDKRKKGLVESRNKADQIVYTTEKTLKEYGDKVSAEEKKKIEQAIERVKSVIHSDNKDEIDRATEELLTASHKIAEEMYKKTTAQTSTPPPEEEKEKEKKEKGKEEGAVDADYEVMDDK
jgi:molecular chaperone DnaK